VSVVLVVSERAALVLINDRLHSTIYKLIGKIC
jgi:hypothetical protein